MDYGIELKFIQELLKLYGLSLFFCDEEITPDKVVANIARADEFAYKNNELNNSYLNFFNRCKPNTIYEIEDVFLCKHIAFLFPSNEQKRILAYIGPYVKNNLSNRYINGLMKKYNLSSQEISKIIEYYEMLPILEDDTYLLSAIYTFCSGIFGGTDKYNVELIRSYYPINGEIFTAINYFHGEFYSKQEIMELELYYDAEEQLMRNVSNGQIAKAEQCALDVYLYYFANRMSKTLRNKKNFLNSLNVILKIAVQNRDIQLNDIEKLHNFYLQRIESMTLQNECEILMLEMVRKYCLLIRNNMMKDYSQLIRNVIALIDFDLSADLSLKKLAKELNVNSSYLSATFKRETTYTLTDYINKKRVEYAIHLLETTDLLIQRIAENCGVRDANYLAKIFRKNLGMTPKEYRDIVRGNEGRMD